MHSWPFEGEEEQILEFIEVRIVILLILAKSIWFGLGHERETQVEGPLELQLGRL